MLVSLTADAAFEVFKHEKHLIKFRFPKDQIGKCSKDNITKTSESENLLVDYFLLPGSPFTIGLNRERNDHI